ncbi:MAG TPA: MFS transporter [Baekduia sp.]|nr:MFS transporter [Baekduia sp.]
MPASDTDAARGRYLKRLIATSAAALAIEAALYSSVAPLLPHYVDELGLSKSQAGLLTGSYTVGMVAGSIGAGVLVACFGARRTVFSGFTLLGLTTLLFGVLQAYEPLTVARLAQGIASGLIWVGMITWLILAAPEKIRGQALGSAMGAALFGTLFGPLIGTVAVAIGAAVTFGVVAAAAIVTGFWILRLEPPPVGVATAISWRAAFSDRAFVVIALVALFPGLVAGLVNVLIPLRIDHVGGTSAAVGATFLCAGVVTAIMSPIVGARADRVGERAVMVGGLLLAAVTLVVLSAVQSWLAIAATTVVVTGFAISACGVPGMSLTSRVGAAAGLAPGAVAAVMNISFAGGETVGAVASAAGAEATSDAVPLLFMGALALTLVLVLQFWARRYPDLASRAG